MVHLSGSAADPFIGSSTLDLTVGTTGSGSLGGMADLLAQLNATAGAVVEVSYTYVPAVPVTPIAVANGTTGDTSTPTPGAYAGPVAGIVNEFASITPDNVAVSAATDSWYVRTGDGDDAIQVYGGTNVLDGGRGSNFLVGGAGEDTFFVDAQWVAAPTWNTIVGLGAGDSVTVWGLPEFGLIQYWRDDEGAAGASGLTLHARLPFSPMVSVTLAGWSQADLDSGRLVSSYGTASDIPYLSIHAV